MINRIPPIVSPGPPGPGGTDDAAVHVDVGGEYAVIPPKATPTMSDVILIEDGAASNAKKKTPWPDASRIANTPAGNIAAITVQGAINELDTEKASSTHDHHSIYSPEAQDADAGTGDPATDTAAIAACFTANNYVRFTAGKTYYINDTITTTDTGCIIELEDGATVYATMAYGQMFLPQSGMTIRGLGNRDRCVLHGDRNNASGKDVSKSSTMSTSVFAAWNDGYGYDHDDLTGILIENITLREFNKGSNQPYGIMILAGCTATFRNIFFDGGVELTLWTQTGTYIFEHVEFDGTGDITASQALNFVGIGGEDVIIRDAHFYNCTRMALEGGPAKLVVDGFYYDGGTASNSYVFSFPFPYDMVDKTVLVQNGTIMNWDQPIEVGGARQIFRNLNFIGNLYTGGASCNDAFTINNFSGQGTDVTIENCSFIENHHWAIGASGAKSLRIKNCGFINGGGISLDQTNGLFDEVVIEGNEFYQSDDQWDIAINGQLAVIGNSLVVRNNRFSFHPPYTPYGAIQYAAFSLTAWAPNTLYVPSGSNSLFRTNDGNIYILESSGTSASSGGPTGTGTHILDGTCYWNYFASVAKGASEYARFESNKFDITSTGTKAIRFVSSAGDNSYLIDNVCITTEGEGAIDLGGAANVTLVRNETR